MQETPNSHIADLREGSKPLQLPALAQADAGTQQFPSPQQGKEGYSS